MKRLWLKWRRQSDDTGTAFITTLFIVTLMAIVAVELVDASRFAVHRSINADQRDQAYWYAIGAREYAISSLQRSGHPARPVMSSAEPWIAGPRTFTLDYGELTGGIRDQNNCVNLNAFIQPPSSEEERSIGITDETARTIFTHVAEYLGISPNVIEPLKAQITDWIDTDTRPEPGGAEDDIYRSSTPAYRAANQLFVETEEMLALPAMTPEVFDLLEDWVCALPIRHQPPLNINTLKPDQAILLSALTDRQLRLADAEVLIMQRPAQGYETLDEFHDRAMSRNDNLGDILIGTTTLRSQWFRVDVAVSMGDMPFTYQEIIQMAPNGRLTRVTHRFGAIQ